MAKISRHALKGIVKECLIEILSEGIGGSSPSQAVAAAADRYPIRESRAPQRQSKTPRRSTSLDNISYRNEVAESRKKEDIGALTEDPLMASIFADTQNTTMASQVEGRGSMSEAVAMQGDIAARAMSENDPVDVFGDAASNWAHLAFAQK